MPNLVYMILLLLLFAISVLPFCLGMAAGSQPDPKTRLILICLAPAIPAALVALMWLGDNMGGDGRLGMMMAVELSPGLIVIALGLALIGDRLATPGGGTPRR